MMVAELGTCRMPEDPISPTPVEGYVVSFVAIYERGFCVSSHRLFHSMLQHYHMELHNLPPSAILHIMAFVTLCEAYTGIDPHFDLWNYLLRIRHPQDLNAELTISGGEGGGVVILV
jgi:hypothetical protein